MQRLKAFVAVLGLSMVATAGVDTLQQGVKGYTGVADMYVVTPVGAVWGNNNWGGPYANPPVDPYTEGYIFVYEDG